MIVHRPTRDSQVWRRAAFAFLAILLLDASATPAHSQEPPQFPERRVPEPLTERSVAAELHQRRRKGVHVAASHELAGHVRLDLLPHAADVGRYER